MGRSTLRWLVSATLVLGSGPAVAQTRVPGLAPVEPDRVTILTIRVGRALPPLVAFQERARQTVEAHLHAEIVSMDELLTRKGSLQKELAQCKGDPRCFARLLSGTIDARYLLVLTASNQDDLRLLGARLIDLKTLSVVGEAVDELGQKQTFLDAIPARIQASVPKDRWDPFGQLQIDINEPGAQVRINERIVGLSPVGKLGFLLPGTYQVAVSKEGWSSANGSANVERNGQAALQLNLQALARPEDEGSVWPWVLGIGGALVVGAAVTAAVVVSSGEDVDPSFCSARDPALCP